MLRVLLPGILDAEVLLPVIVTDVEVLLPVIDAEVLLPAITDVEVLLPVIVIDVEVLLPVTDVEVLSQVMMHHDNSDAGGAYRCVMNSDRPFACSFSRWS